MPVTMFFGALFVSHVMEIGFSAYLEALLGPWEVGLGGQFAYLLGTVAMLVGISALLVNNRVRQGLGLGDIDQHEQAAARPRTRSERMSFITRVLQSLPLTEYHAEDDLRKSTIAELKGIVEEMNNKKPKSSRIDVHGCLEKEELVQAIVQADQSSSSSMCIICCEDYCSGDTLRVLNCGHKFHVECIDRWFLSSTDYSRPAACPMCNAELKVQQSSN